MWCLAQFVDTRAPMPAWKLETGTSVYLGRLLPAFIPHTMPSRLLTTIRISLFPSTQKRLSPSVFDRLCGGVYGLPGHSRPSTNKIPSIGCSHCSTELLTCTWPAERYLGTSCK